MPSRAEEALIEAAKQGDLATLTRLVEERVNLEARDWDGWTALIRAALNGKLGCLDHLIAKGANLEATTEYGRTALMDAADNGKLDFLDHLIAKGANVNFQNRDKRTALHFAANHGYGYAPCVESLLKAGADASLKDLEGDTALDNAKEDNAKETEVIKLLENTPWFKAQASKAAPPTLGMAQLSVGGAINQPGHWDFFLSHTQRDPLAVMLAEMLCSELSKMGKTVWLDVHMSKRDMAAMEEGAKNCKCFLAIVTDNGQDSYFSRPMCRDEIKWAQVAERTIVPVCGADDKKNIMALINGGKEHGIDFSSYNMVDIDRSAPRRLKASVEDILEQAGML